MTGSFKHRVLFVGAFPPKGKPIFGGNVTACRTLMQSSFPKRLDLDLIDSTQLSNPAPHFVVRLLLAMRRFLTFIIRFEKRKPDAVLLFTGSGAGFIEKGLMGWYTRIRHSRSFIFPRGGGLLHSYSSSRGVVPGWTKALFGSAEKIFCQGPTWREYVMRGLGRPEIDAPIIPNWTATDELLAIGKNRRLLPASGETRLLFVGWVEQEKGIFELLAAVRDLSDQGGYALDIVGHGRALPAARSFVKENGISDIVTFHGWLEGADLVGRYRDSDVFVLPSWAEGLPNAMIEAMAAGLCIVTTPVGNIPDVIEDRRNGILVPPRNTLALKIALGGLLTDEGLRSRLSGEAHETALQRFSVEPAVDIMIRAMFEG